MNDAPLNSLIDSNVSPKVKTMEEEKFRACSLTCNTSRVEEHAKAPRSGLG
jgi:hypothetical protein